MSFQYRVALVTGASSGIGKALAFKLADKGCKLALVGRRMDELDASARKINEQGGNARPFPADVADRNSIYQVADQVEKTLGPIDLVIANAGVSMQFSAAGNECEKIDQTYRTNLLGSLYTIHAALQGMIARGHGHIVGISSLASYNGLPLKGSYCGSKAALRTELEAMRVELRSRGIYVTTICPGFIKTPMTEKNDYSMPFLLELDDAANRMMDAIEKRKRVCNFPWQATLLTKLTSRLPEPVYDFVMGKAASRVNEK
jgi:short-subunit dehydrogenase